MQEPQGNDHDKVVRLDEWRKGHDEKTHPDIATEIRELRGTINKFLWAIVGLMITITAGSIGFALNSVGG